MSGSLAVVVDPRFESAPLVAQARAVAGGEPVVAFVADPEGTGSSQAPSDIERSFALGGDGMPGADAESLVAALERACRQEDVELLALPSTVHWREVAALLAARLDGAVSSEVTALRLGADGTLLADRLLYSGLVVATVALLDRPAVVTVAVPEASDAAPRAVVAERGEPVDRGARVLVSQRRLGALGAFAARLRSGLYAAPEEASAACGSHGKPAHDRREMRFRARRSPSGPGSGRPAHARIGAAPDRAAPVP